MNATLSDESTSKSLISGLRVGSWMAWAKLAELYGPLIRQWCRVFGVDDSTQNDIAQNVLLIVIKKVPQFRHDHPQASFRGWLWTITRNELIRNHRHHLRQRPLPNHSLEQRADDTLPDESPPDLPDANRDLLRRALNMLRTQCQSRTWEIFVASVMSRASAAEIAAQFDTTAGNVRKIKSTYTAKLRDLLELTDDGDTKTP